MGQGFFENDADYEARMAQEANERIIENSTGVAPHQGIFEDTEHYLDRIRQEATERVIEDSTGSAPHQGLFEDTEDYLDRIRQEATERIIEDSTGSAPRQGFFEDTQKYETRTRLEANEAALTRNSGQAPSQGFFEDDYEYRKRVAHEARESLVERGASGAAAWDEVESPSIVSSSQGSSMEDSGSGSSSFVSQYSSPAAEPTGSLGLLAILGIGLILFLIWAVKGGSPTVSPIAYSPASASFAPPPIAAPEPDRAALQPTELLHCGHIQNRSREQITFQVWSDRAGWEPRTLRPGASLWLGRPGDNLRIRWNASLRGGNPIPKIAVLDSRRILGTPSEAESREVPSSFFRYTRNGELGIFRH